MWFRAFKIIASTCSREWAAGYTLHSRICLLCITSD